MGKRFGNIKEKVKIGLIIVGLLLLSYFTLPELWDTALGLGFLLLIIVILIGILLGIALAIRFVVNKVKRS